MFILLLVIFVLALALQNKAVYPFVYEGPSAAMAENTKSVEIVYRVAPASRRKPGFKGWLCFMVRRRSQSYKFFTGAPGISTYTKHCMQFFTNTAEIRV